MAKRTSRDSGRFRIYTSGRSGFDFGFQPITSPPNQYTRESGKPVNDKGVSVSPSEFDQPPPSNLPLGGEGEISGDPRSNSNFSVDSNIYLIPPESTKLIQYVTPTGGITWNDQPFMYIAGSNSNVVLNKNPQINAGSQSQQISALCVGSSITLINGSGLALHSSFFVMDSGAIISFFYSATDNLWHETSRSHQLKDYGQF